MAVDRPVIVIIENDAVQRDLITMALRKINCHAIPVSSGLNAVKTIEETRPDLVLLDLFLPQINGLEILHRLQESGKLSLTTVIVISSMSYMEVVEQAKEAGAHDFLIKPFESDLLLERVKNALKRREKSPD